MSANSLWLNLPSGDLSRARNFFTEIGFEMNTSFDAPHMVSMVVGANRVIVNFFDEKMMQEFMGGQSTTDTANSNEVLFTLGANSIEEVDAITQKARKAGARIFAEPGHKDGWMYGSGFVDPDGHRWNLLYMDMSKFSK